MGKNTSSAVFQEEPMAHLPFMMFDTGEGFGLWIFLSVGAVALFGVFIPFATWIEARRKEREAFYKAETLRRLSESSTEGARTALEMLREEGRREHIKIIEGLKIGGLICIGVGVGLVIFLRVLLGPGGVPNSGAGSAYLCGLIPGLVGVAMLVYVYVLAAPVE
jgi:hypothetical protein